LIWLILLRLYTGIILVITYKLFVFKPTVPRCLLVVIFYFCLCNFGKVKRGARERLAPLPFTLDLYTYTIYRCIMYIYNQQRNNDVGPDRCGNSGGSRGGGTVLVSSRHGRYLYRYISNNTPTQHCTHCILYCVYSNIYYNIVILSILAFEFMRTRNVQTTI